MLCRGLTIVVAAAAIVIASHAPAAAVTTVGQNAATVIAQYDLVALVNAYRTASGVRAVSPNGALTAAAGWMAGDMAARNYIGHVSSDGRSPTQRMSAFGYPATSMYTGEDLGAGYATPTDVLAGWQASPAHNAVLLNPNYDAIGIGLVYAPSSTYKWYWAADFGGPGGTVKVVVPVAPQPQPVAPRAASAPRGSVPQAVPAETIDPQAATRDARIAFLEAVGARRAAHLFAVLLRMGAI